MLRPGLKLAAGVVVAIACCLTSNAQSPGTTTREDGYEVSRSQTLARAPYGKQGRKTTDRESRVGYTEETDGNSYNFVMTLGGFVNKCPIPDANTAGKFVVPGDFEYALTANEVITGEGETQRNHYAKRVDARFTAHLKDDAMLDELEMDAVYTSEKNGVRDAPRTDRRRFRIGEGGMPDLKALTEASIVTGDLAIAGLMWNASQVYYASQLEWLKPDACVELAFDPPSDERTLRPNQSQQVRVTLQTKDGKHPVAQANFRAGALNGVGQLSPRQGDMNDDGVVTLTYTASANPKAGHGFDFGARSRAGIAASKWRISEGALKLAIEHRIWDDRGTPGALVGNALFDGTVKFDVSLAPMPHRPGTLSGKAAVVRQMEVSHVTSRCRGSASQGEEWNVIATIDAATKALRLDPSRYTGDGVGEWTCVPAGRDDLEVDLSSDLQPFVVRTTIGTPQNFVVSREDGNHETITVTVLAMP